MFTKIHLCLTVWTVGICKVTFDYTFLNHRYELNDV
jgi:hypothetical protein